MEMARCAEATTVPIIARLAGPDALAPLPIELEPPMATALNPEVVELKPMATPLPATSVTTNLVPMVPAENGTPAEGHGGASGAPQAS